MTDSDVLARAARALREAHTGERQGAGFTRARIMNTVHRERRRRVLRWAVFSPIASALLVGSAWAQSTGQWPVIWRAVTSVLVGEPGNEEDHRAESGKSLPPAPAPPDPSHEPGQLPDNEPLDASTGAIDEPAPLDWATPPAPALRTADEQVPSRRAPARQRGQRRASVASPNDAPVSAPEAIEKGPPLAREPAPDNELSRFRAAHDLHFAGNRAREAIRAYAEYLRDFPNGRFVPEARYNGALDQIKVGNEAAAREALVPFAAGRFGGYRQKEARELLEALERRGPPSGSKR